MPRSHRWRQVLAAKFDQLGRRLGGGPVVGPHGAFVALPHTELLEPISFAEHHEEAA
jgi:hypothetical protein